MNNFKPIFIIGVGRSGTSMLQSMLNSHSQIAFPPETHFIRNYLSSGKVFKTAKDILLNDQYLKNLEIDLEQIYRISDSFHSFYERMMTEYLDKKKKTIIGDKDPKNIENIKEIYKYFPNALIIHIYRDPRAVIASRLKAEWSKDNPLWQHILAYKAQLNYIETNKFIFKENYIQIKYEDLLINPEEELKKISTKLNLPFEKEMLNFFKNSSEVVKGNEKNWKENLFKPVMIENIDKWSSELEPSIVKKIENSLYIEMKKYKYKYNSSSYFIAYIYKILSYIYCAKNCN